MEALYLFEQASVTSTAKRSPDLGKVVITCWLKLLVQKLNWYK